MTIDKQLELVETLRRANAALSFGESAEVCIVGRMLARKVFPSPWHQAVYFKARAQALAIVKRLRELQWDLTPRAEEHAENIKRILRPLVGRVVVVVHR